MKYKISLILIFIILLYPVAAQDRIPPVNRSILEYVNTVIGEQVGRGECWDLADEALKKAHAKFDRSSEKTLYIFGRRYSPSKEKILPGDIIQFYNVVVRYQKANMIITENLTHHTAIVYAVNNDNEITLAHQNTNYTGKKVGLSKLNLEHVQKGKLYFYHPISL